MIKNISTLLVLVGVCGIACASLPPTTSKISGDSVNKTTFNYQFPNLTGTHTGITVSIPTYPIPSPGPSGDVATSNGAGAWISQANSAAAGVTSNGSSQRLDNILFAGNASGSTKCTTSPCTISAQSGSWVSSVTRNSAGNYVINVVGGEFSTVPICVCSADIQGIAAIGVCEVDFSTSTTTAINIFVNASTTATAEDAAVAVICQGTH